MDRWLDEWIGRQLHVFQLHVYMDCILTKIFDIRKEVYTGLKCPQLN